MTGMIQLLHLMSLLLMNRETALTLGCYVNVMFFLAHIIT